MSEAATLRENPAGGLPSRAGIRPIPLAEGFWGPIMRNPGASQGSSPFCSKVPVFASATRGGATRFPGRPGGPVSPPRLGMDPYPARGGKCSRSSASLRGALLAEELRWYYPWQSPGDVSHGPEPLPAAWRFPAEGQLHTLYDEDSPERKLSKKATSQERPKENHAVA